MTVQELITALKKHDPNMNVIIYCNDGMNDGEPKLWEAEVGEERWLYL